MRKPVLPILGLIVAAPAFAAGGFQAGYWEFTLLKDGKPIQSNKRCLTDIKELTRLSAINRRYCKQLSQSVRDGKIVSKNHCKYPNLERTASETLTFDGDTATGHVEIHVIVPKQESVALDVSGKRLSASCPGKQAANNHR